MKSLKQYILESLCEIDRNNFAENCPEFYSAVSQFCRDKNSEDGIDYLIAAWTCTSQEDFNKFSKNSPFSQRDLREFEEKYLNDTALEEIEKFING